MTDFTSDIDMIISDTVSGSNAILEKTIREIVSYLQNMSKPDFSLLKIELLRLFSAHPNFAVLFHFINSFLRELQMNPESQSLLAFIAGYSQRWSAGLDQACQNLLHHEDLKSKNVLVHSNSSAIHLLFKKASENAGNVRIYQTISSPGEEGRVQAGKLSQMGFEVYLIHESAAGNFIGNIDFAVFGADVITKDFFINKAGTFPLTLLFNHYHKPVYVLSDSRKILNTDTLPDRITGPMLEEPVKQPQEIWKNPPANVHPVSYWFEKTPIMQITGLITEQGFVEPSEISGMVKGISLSEFFQDFGN